MSDAVPSWPDLAGKLEPGQHRLPVRVYFEDTDFSGIVYHGSYLRWCERGRSDYLRLLGISHRDLAAGTAADRLEATAFVVRRLTLDFLKPARIDDLLEVVTRPQTITTATLTLEQTITLNSVPLCRAEVLLALVSAAGRPVRLPPLIRDRMAPCPQ